MLFCFGISFADMLRRFLTTWEKKTEHQHKTSPRNGVAQLRVRWGGGVPPTFAFFESSILLKMSFAWDSRAAKLDAFRGSEVSLNFFAFFFPPSFTLGVLGAFGIFGGLGALWALVDFGVFCRALTRLCDSTWAGETGSSGSEWAEVGCSTGSEGATIGSFLTALFAFCKR